MIISPFFSVIIPTYNRPELLVRALESVIDQSFKRFEVLVINDGSDKGLIEYEEVKRLYLHYENIIFIDKQNEGPSIARNTGILNAKGEFICFLDDDDYYLENHLSEMYELIQSKNCVPAMYRTFSYFKEDSKDPVPQQYSKQGNDHAIMYVLENFILMNNVCLSRIILDKYLFNPLLKVAEDSEMWVRILAKYPIFEKEVYTAVYDKTRESISSGSVPVFLNYISSFEAIFNLTGVNVIIPDRYKVSKYKKIYSWIIAVYLRSNDIESYIKLKSKLVNHVGFIFYIFHYLRFKKRSFFK